MNVALSLSGGGFRATLFHLGVIGYLRRVGILDRVVAVCGVSGGAIIGAHLVHNWEHYTGSEDAFTKAAREVIRLTQRDVRGRILRRLPWGLFLKPIPLLKISRCGMFERELTRFFDGELLSSAVRNNGHNRPELFILATDLATGQSCSFSARGFSRDGADNAPTMETNVLKTATAVATSASFPGFFPPQVVTPESLGITREAWGAQQESYLTDGGVFDNLGVRKLQSLRQRLSVDVEILSDAGATLEPRPGRFSGLVRTALRAVDILSNRVQTLEYERVNRQDAAVSFAYAHAPGGLPGEPAVPLQRAELNGTGTPALIPIRIKDPVRVDHAPGPSIQAVLQRVRTDLDRFSDTEIRWLVRHGGSVARQAIEHREAVLTDIDLNRGKQAPWDPMRAVYPRRRWDEPDERTERLAWKDLKASNGRRLGLLSLTDWVSWVNLIALVVATVLILLTVDSVTTRASFLSQAYNESYNVTFRYAKESAKEWAQENHPELIPFVTGKTDDPPSGVSAEAERQATAYRNNAGRTGQGRAFLRVIPPPNFKMPDDLNEDERREAVAAMRANSESLWKGILYYRFPSSARDRAEASFVRKAGLLSGLLPNWKDPVTVLQFEGRAISSREICLDFAQDGNSYSRFSIKFELESRLSGPPIVPRNGNLIRPRSQPAAVDTEVNKSPDPCGIADDGFVLGMMRLE